MKTANLFLIVPAILFGSLKSSNNISVVSQTNHVFETNYVFQNVLDKEDIQNATLPDIDAAVDQLIPLNHVYTFNEAVDLRKELESELKTNPNSVVVSWALIRFYACAPNFVGGNKSAAIQHASYLYSMNKYLGCLAYEFVYTKSYQISNAENWYKQSLICPLPKGMLWQDIKYNKTVQSRLEIVGNFNNWKTQNMYENSYGTYSRRVMTPKCENCQYKVIVDYKSKDVPSRAEFVVAG